MATFIFFKLYPSKYLLEDCEKLLTLANGLDYIRAKPLVCSILANLFKNIHDLENSAIFQTFSFLFLGTSASLTEAVWVAVIAAAPAKKAAVGQENLQSSEPAVAETEGQGEKYLIAIFRL